MSQAAISNHAAAVAGGNLSAPKASSHRNNRNSKSPSRQQKQQSSKDREGRRRRSSYRADSDDGERQRRSSGGASGDEDRRRRRNSERDEDERRRRSSGGASGDEDRRRRRNSERVDGDEGGGQGRRRSGGGDAPKSSRHSTESRSPSSKKRHHRQPSAGDASGAVSESADHQNDHPSGTSASVAVTRARSLSSQQAEKLRHQKEQQQLPHTPTNTASHVAPGNVRLSAPEDVVALEMPEYDSPVLNKTRVTSTRSRLEGSNVNGLRWAIHTDTPGGHTFEPLRLQKGAELDDHEYDDVADLAVAPGLIPRLSMASSQKLSSPIDKGKNSVALGQSPHFLKGSDASPGKPQRTSSKVSDFSSPPSSPRRNKTKMDTIIQGLMQQEKEKEIRKARHDTSPGRNSENDSDSFEGSLDASVDDTLQNSDHLPMTKLNQELYQSTTWDNPNDFSCSDGEDDAEDDPSHVEYGKGIGHGVIPSDFDDDDGEDEETEYDDEPRGYIQNAGYNTASVPGKKERSSANEEKGKKSTSSKSKTAEEQSIDPMADFTPYDANESEGPDDSMASSAFPEDSLADIADSFACDDGTLNFPKPEFNNSNVTGFGNSTSNVPRGHLLDSARGDALNGTAHTETSSKLLPPGSRSKPGRDTFSTKEMIGAVSGVENDNSTRSSKNGAPVLKGSQRDSSGRSGPIERRVPPGRSKSTDLTELPSVRSWKRPVHSAAVVNQFADSFGILSPGGSAGDKNDSRGDMNHRSSSTLGSESSSSYTYGMGLVAEKHMQSSGLNPYSVPDSDLSQSTPFMQFDLGAADGIQVRTNQEVETGEDEEENLIDPEGPSIAEFNKNDLPASDHVGAIPSRGLPRKGLERDTNNTNSRTAGSIRNLRLGLKKNTSINVKPGRKAPGRTSSKADSEIVKRFFSFANSSFGSLASSQGELLDDEDGDDDLIFE